MNKTFTSQSGFTLVEVLVAISLLLMVIVGPLQILSRTNNSTAFATEQMTAWFLAQEGLELVQQVRDGYLLQYFDDSSATLKPWALFAATTTASTGKLKPCFTNGCDITLNAAGVATVVDCTNNGAACDLKLDTNAAKRMRYNITTGNPTSPTFRRVIIMTETGRGREVSATSTVTWRTGSLIVSQKVETVTSLFNIYDKE